VADGLDAMRLGAALVYRLVPLSRRLEPQAFVETIANSLELELDMRLEAAAAREVEGHHHGLQDHLLAGHELLRRGVGGALQATSTRRALMLTALGALLIAGIVTAAPIGERGPLGRYAAAEGLRPAANPTFADATPGSCITWPDNSPDTAAVVDCSDDHRFEVAESIDLRAYPGTEYGPDAAPPSPARIQQISAEQCEPAVKRYLAAKYDPNSRFSISLLWPGDKAWQQSGERRMLCGLQLPGPANQQIVFKGRVADLDQSKIWPTGTCLGLQ
jgi:hypothetical protein